ncbi:carboxy terminal-processing peptidase [Parafilimonas sp.]|uniref:carboxy terminal-processing peptidase n=1 Tax=Parafilimonas sp. TaxID=1969739 RepID=UPI0039E4B944
MLRRTVLPAALIVLLGVTLWAFKRNDKSPETKEQMLLTVIGTILEQKHYAPKPIDDKFSKQVFTKYLEALNPDKNIFLQPDVDYLKKYELTLDDEIKGAPLQFYTDAATIYLKRMDEVVGLCKEILSKPFDFTAKEEINLDDEKARYPADTAARKEFWRKRLKYLTLDQYTDLLQQRNNKTKDTAIANKTDIQLEQLARTKVQTVLDRSFNRQKMIFNGQEQFNTYVNVITDLMDPHTEYFPPVESRSFEEDLSGRFYGIGAQLKDDDGAIKIATLITGSPAWKSGKVQVNDEIIKVGQGKEEPVDVRGYAVTDAVKLIRGSKGSEVKITFKKTDGSTEVVSLIRDEIVQDEQFARSAVINQPDGKIGYIFLPEFYADFDRPDGNRCSQDVANEIIKLKKENVQGIILDLRNNGGGSLPEVVNMVGLFIKSGPVVQVKDRNGKPAILSDNDTSVLYDGPLAVMVNEFSASASEIFAAAIQDYKRGIIVGSDTYGKGTVQRTLPLGKPLDLLSGQTEYGTLKLTFEKFYRINGGSTQLKGVTPDVAMPDPYDYLKLREKDQPTALAWDQLEKADFTPFNAGINWNTIETGAKSRIQSNTAFNTLAKNSLWLKDNADKSYSLNLTEYQKQQTLLKNAVKQDDSLSRLTTPMNIQPVAVDSAKYYSNADSAKGGRYLQWLKNVQKDVYINETVSIVNDINKAH